MNAKEVVACRIKELCKERGIAVNHLAAVAKVPASTIYSILNEKSQNPGIVSIEAICSGLDISI